MSGHVNPESPIRGAQRRPQVDLTPIGQFQVIKNPQLDIDLNTVLTQIDAKAGALQPLPGEPVGNYERLGTGFGRRYEGATIYYSPTGGVREVHGAIREKYDALGGPTGGLGFPLTDEQSVGDDAGGQYSDFEYGSIYWTDHTGPMMLRKEIRDRWRTLGGPNAVLDGRVSGYPVKDQHHQPAISSSYNPSSSRPAAGNDVTILQSSGAIAELADVMAMARDPGISWATFENGIIVQTKDGIEPALAAIMTEDELRMLVRSRIDEAMRESPDNVGLHPATDISSVTGWRYGFWTSGPRQVTFVLHGFRDNGLLPDTNFEMRLAIEFKLVWNQTSFAPPAVKTLVAELVGPFRRVVWDAGRDVVIPVLPGEVIEGVAAGIHRAFFPDEWPDPAHPEVPKGAVWVADVPVLGARDVVNVLDVLSAPDGALLFFVNPLPTSPIHYGIARRNQLRDVIVEVISNLP